MTVQTAFTQAQCGLFATQWNAAVGSQLSSYAPPFLCTGKSCNSPSATFVASAAVVPGARVGAAALLLLATLL